MTQTLCAGDGTASLTWQAQSHLWEGEYAPVWGLSPSGCKQTGFQEWEACPGLPPHSAPQTSSSCPLSGCFSPPRFPLGHTPVTGFSPRVGFSVDLLLCTSVCVCLSRRPHLNPY